ncbi:excalibur calcium-binding domain-containing protein [Luteimonas sp. SJ-92]|uniref:Excalibur calcium-binding domain-containing protein n=1 Tax=Luteimonas salinisoli TaxID=2752307 RepID=A0A853JF34_9GAMM|nr:excalibur calcium-binding domain-containing protein [Luteimonas salinisoli]
MRPTLFGVGFWIALACSAQVQAHGGGLNKDGCHNDRKSSGYHCHRGQSAPPPLSPMPPPQNTPARHDLTPGGGSSPSRAFRNCDEARAAGAAPVRRGDPGYGPHLDRDNDGIGCEPYRGR